MNAAVTAPRVDAHHHVWELARGDYGWLTPKLEAIHRDFGFGDMQPLLMMTGIKATVLVQAAPTVAETEFLLRAARASGGIARAVVGWVDLASQDAPATLARLAQDPRLKSIRPMLQDLPDPEWILRSDVDRNLGVLERLGLRFDALVKPRELPALLRMIERHPHLPIVVDHGAKPRIGLGSLEQWEPWATGIAAVARHPNVVCKLSGLATEAYIFWGAETLRPYVDHLLHCFGPDRLLWGSDWPVVELGGGYAKWYAATQILLGGLPPADRDAILGGNAWRFYDLGDPERPPD